MNNPGTTNQTDQKLESLLTPYDVAALLKIGKSQAYRLVESRELPAVRIGRLVRIRPADLQEYLEKKRS